MNPQLSATNPNRIRNRKDRSRAGKIRNYPQTTWEVSATDFVKSLASTLHIWPARRPSETVQSEACDIEIFANKWTKALDISQRNLVYTDSECAAQCQSFMRVQSPLRNVLARKKDSVIIRLQIIMQADRFGYAAYRER